MKLSSGQVFKSSLGIPYNWQLATHLSDSLFVLFCQCKTSKPICSVLYKSVNLVTLAYSLHLSVNIGFIHNVKNKCL